MKKEKKKIAFLLPSLAGGGAEKVAVVLANHFTFIGFNVDIILVSNSGVYHHILLPEVNVVDLKVSRALFAFPKILRHLSQNTPDVLLSFLTHVNLLALLVKFFQRTKTRMIISERSILSNSLLTHSYFQRFIFKHLIKKLYPRADAIIAISKSCANDLAQTSKISKTKISVIYNPLIIDTSITKLLCVQENIYSKLIDDKRKGNFIIIGIGRLKKVKNFLLLIKAFACVNMVVPSTLVILGDGPERYNLEKLIEDLNLVGKVHLTGFVDNPSIFLKISDVFVSSSSWEGFGNVILEAMNEGLKIVACDCPGGPREILEDGLWGTLVPTDNVDELANSIMKVIFDENSPDVKKRAIQFDLPTIANEYLKVLNLNYNE
jgi:glycosyltransferase involved in cell wall biosynthesis